MLQTRARRVAVTGLGVVTTIGESPAEFFDGLAAGRSGITRLRRVDKRCYAQIGADLSAFELDAHLARVGAHYPAELARQARRLLRATPLPGRLTAAAALHAFVDAGLGESPVAADRLGHVLAGHNLNAFYTAENVRQFDEEPEFIDSLMGLLCLDTDVLSVISELLSIRGPSFTVGGACASGNMALLAGLDAVRAGRADAVVVSGAASDVDFAALHSWAMMDALSIRSFNDAPERASRPFDALREGFVPSHAAAVVILESWSSARARGVPIRAELLGAGATSDATRQPTPSLDGQVRAMRGALADAGVEPGEVDYVNAHATSTPLGDAMEVASIKAVLGPRAYRVPVNSTKSMIGHSLTAAGVVELVATILQLERGVVHPTINQEERDPALDLDFVPNRAREHPARVAISNAFGFGGLNACVVVGRETERA